MNNKKVNKFFDNFIEHIYPAIKGEDGQGIERLKSIVEKKRSKVEERKKQKSI